MGIYEVSQDFHKRKDKVKKEVFIYLNYSKRTEKSEREKRNAKIFGILVKIVKGNNFFCDVERAHTGCRNRRR